MVNETPDLALCYQLQTEAVTYRTAEDFARLIADIVATPDKYAQIAQAGYRRTMAEHTATKRVAQLMQLIDQCVHNY